MRADRGCARHLKIDLLRVALHPARRLLQDCSQRFVRHRKLDAQKVEARAKAREVFAQRKKAVPLHAQRLVYTVSKIDAAIERGNSELVHRRKYAVVVSDLFHPFAILFCARRVTKRLRKRLFSTAQKRLCPAVFACPARPVKLTSTAFCCTI